MPEIAVGMAFSRRDELGVLGKVKLIVSQEGCLGHE